MSTGQRLLRAGMRNGWNRGVVDGKPAWVILGGVSLLGYLAARAMRREPQVVFSQHLDPGESLTVTHEALIAD